MIAIADAAIRGIPMGYIGAGNVFDSAEPVARAVRCERRAVQDRPGLRGAIAVAGLRDGTNLC